LLTNSNTPILLQLEKITRLFVYSFYTLKVLSLYLNPLFEVVGVIGVAVSALFYLDIERVIKKQYKGHSGARIAAWIHLILMNIGTAVAMGLLMLAGYRGGAAMLPTSVGGLGLDAGQAHEILAPFVEPIAVAILILIFGIICVGIGFLLLQRLKN
jgi:hypothetical protein